jgi:hypothetical protein
MNIFARIGPISTSEARNRGEDSAPLYVCAQLCAYRIP